MADLTLVAGIVLVALSIVGLISGWSESRLSTRGAAVMVLGAGLIVTSHVLSPEGVSLERIPMAFVDVVRSVID